MVSLFAKPMGMQNSKAFDPSPLKGQLEDRVRIPRLAEVKAWQIVRTFFLGYLHQEVGIQRLRDECLHVDFKILQIFWSGFDGKHLEAARIIQTDYESKLFRDWSNDH